jgi:hypothetical protein
MIITKTQTEPLTIELLNALLANFATGAITLEQLWEAIERAEDAAYFRNNLINPMEFPDSIKNRMSGLDTEAGI